MRSDVHQSRHLKSNLEALEIDLFPDDMERLDKIELPEDRSGRRRNDD
jgi:diketogulonate reductase-like aldo/keto reductase